MSWLDQYQAGSFRGAAFKCQSSETSGGRRGTLHEFPRRDLPYFQDLGRLAKSYNIEAIVIGDDYFAQRDALIAALDEQGSGLLIHPYLGQIQVAAPQYGFSESSEYGGMARFTISFVEAGRVQAGDAAADTAIASDSAADEVLDAAETELAEKFSIADLPAYVEAEMAQVLDQLGIEASDIAAVQMGVGDALDLYQSALSQVNDGITLLRSPITLARSVRQLVRGVAGLAVLPIGRINALLRLFDTPDRFEPVLGNTPVRAAHRSNLSLLSQAIREMSAAETVRAVSSLSFNSFDEAQILRDAIADRFDGAALLAADAGDDRHSDALDIMRRAMVRDINARSINLARLFEYRPQMTEPALVIANHIYGHEEAAIRADEIISRNAIIHPGFVPAKVLILRTPSLS